MKRVHLSLLAAASSILISNTAFAAAFQFYELATPIIGTAAVGQAVVANDASTAYFNPAGMAHFQSSQYLLGAQLFLPYTNFHKNARDTIAGSNGGNAASLVPGLDLYYVYSYSPQLKFGVSLTSPYGGLLNYNDGWAGRYLVESIQLLTLNLNPSIAYQVNNWLSLGAGVAVEYASLYETISLPIIKLVDGEAIVKLNDTAWGYNVGAMFKPTEATNVGIAYRSKINHKLHGSTSFLRIGITPRTTSRIVMPNNVIISLSQAITKQITLLGEVGWAHWSTMKSSVLNVAEFSATIKQDWHNTYRYGIAGQYKITPDFLIQTGVSYDTSPTRSTLRTPDLPMDRQIRAGAGIDYNIMRGVQIAFSYEYINFGKANIDNTSSDGVFAGTYKRNWGNVFQASVNVGC